MNRFSKFAHIGQDKWADWKWQLQNRIDSNADIKSFFPNMEEQMVSAFISYVKKYHFAITPYTLSLIQLDKQQNPMPEDPIWNQFRILMQDELQLDGQAAEFENWENSAEFPTKILQHKYPDKAIIRITNTCFSYCNYCYLTLRIINKSTSRKRNGNTQSWDESLDYLHNNPQIQDVLLSGGEPLLLDNDRLEKIFSSLKKIDSIKSIRLNTRVFTFNPYRFDKELIQIFKKYKLTALEVHISHPNEITEEVDERLALFDEVGYRPLILWRAPLLGNVNNSEETLKQLFLKLYRRRILPYYIFHYAPSTLGRAKYGLSVKSGVKLLQKLRRTIPGPAFPRYTLFHMDGKVDIPLTLNGADDFRYEIDSSDRPIIKLKNWKNKWVTYNDVEEL